MWKSKLYSYYLFFLIFCCISCKDSHDLIGSDYLYIEPEYEQVELKIGTDTIKYNFPDSVYHKIQSFDIFQYHDSTYISFFDNKRLDYKPQMILIFNYTTKRFITKIPIARFIDPQGAHFNLCVKNFDSIYIFTYDDVQLFDSAGVLKKKISGIKAKPEVQAYSNGTPPIFIGNKLYTGINPPLVNLSFEKLKDYNVLYEFDFGESSYAKRLNLPGLYYEQYYGYPYLKNSFCVNDSGKFVFSFAADTSIYETNLYDYHKRYYGKSIHQNTQIIPVSTREEAERPLYAKKNYELNDAYGAIYFDRFRKRYFRIALQKLKDTSSAGRKKRPKSIIIFDQKFKIIGEAPIPQNVDMERMYFSNDGEMYAELLPKRSFSVSFVRLEFKEHNTLAHN